MIINCVWEHNGNDTLLYATNFVGAYTRGESLEIAKAKMPQEIVSYCNWLGMEAEGKAEIVIVGEKCSELTIRDVRAYKECEYILFCGDCCGGRS